MIAEIKLIKAQLQHIKNAEFPWDSCEEARYEYIRDIEHLLALTEWVSTEEIKER